MNYEKYANRQYSQEKAMIMDLELDMIHLFLLELSNNDSIYHDRVMELLDDIGSKVSYFSNRYPKKINWKKIIEESFDKDYPDDDEEADSQFVGGVFDVYETAYKRAMGIDNKI